VRAVLQPPLDSQDAKGGDKHKASIRAVLGELGVSADEPVAEFWLGLTGEGNPSGLAMRAHRPALDAPGQPTRRSSSSSTVSRSCSTAC
jgi:hypothetical protein